MNLRTFGIGLLTALAALVLLLSPGEAFGKTKNGQAKGQTEEKGKQGPVVQRVPNTVFEIVRNNVSNIEFVSSNYGIFGLNVVRSQAGGLWPRGSGKAYIFGGGVWFGAKKRVSDTLRKMAVISYNPNSGASWMVPGRVTYPIDKSSVDEGVEAINKYRVYHSTEYNSFTGQPIDNRDKINSGANWPIWDTNPGDSLKVDRYFGFYIDDLTLRNRETYSKGPAIISQEDIFSTFKDTDLGQYEIGKGLAQKQGYPLGIQVEQTIYSWGFGLYKDFVFLKYSIINMSSDTLYDCVMAPAMDMDIGEPANDHTKIAIERKENDTLNMGVQWSEDETRTFGYIGFDFLESPAIDDNGFIRKDKKFYSQSEQLGLRTFRNWIIQIDPTTPEERYNFMETITRDGDNGGGDKRFLMSTGTFNMLPHDTARVVVGLILANGYDPNNPGVAEVPTTGQWENMKRLIDLDTFAQSVYDNNFKAPTPPDPANVTWKPLNAGIELHWDTLSERSIDLLERGLDFSGYTIQRTRRAVNGFTQTDSIQGWNIGWKTIGGVPLPAMPDSALRNAAWRNNDMRILGAWWRLPMLADVDTTQGNLVDAQGRRIGVQLTQVRAVDTIRRPGLSDSLRPTNRIIDSIYTYYFKFDPFNDRSDDSTLFNSGTYADPKYNGRYQNKAIRDVVRDAISEIMDSVTNGRTFIDVGDDNFDGQVTENPSNLTTNEKLINNVDYYYRVLAYDEGSPGEGTPSKTNTGLAGINEVRATPEAPPAGRRATPEVISSDGLGGIRNVRFNVFDEMRLGQLFGGDTLEFQFFPTDLRRLGVQNLWYTTEVIVRSLKRGGELQRFYLAHDFDLSDRADSVPRNLDTGFVSYYDSAAKVYIDRSQVRVPFNGTFLPRSEQPIYGTVGIFGGTFGLTYDYSFQQFGDSLRFGRFGDPASETAPATITNGDANVNVVGKVQYLGQTIRTAGGLYYSIPSIGQPKIEVEFLPGGTETITYTKSGKTITVPNVQYLNVRVKNVASYTRDVIGTDGQITQEPIQYDYEFPADQSAKLNADTTSDPTVRLARLIRLGEYGLYAFGWQDADTLEISLRERALTRTRYTINNGTGYIGTPGRYYTGKYDVVDADGVSHKVSFTHLLMVNGAEISIDFAGMGNPESITRPEWVPDSKPDREFEANDKFTVDFTGGALGLPEPGATVRVAVPEITPALSEYTDDLLDQIKVVPNPYLISHIGQRTNNDRRIYFTRLPAECTIEIYTAAGELLQTLEHKAPDADGRVAVDAWDLASKANRQAQSQLLIARITTPNGSETIKKFSIVVGGFRIVGQ